MQPQLVKPNERRGEPRTGHPNSAEVLIEEPGRTVAFQAVLINDSHGGMCIRHWSKDLAIGRTVRISSPAFPQTAARVVWNWAVGPVVISGLQRVEDHSSARTVLLSFIKDPRTSSGEGISSLARGQLRTYLLGTAAGLLLIAAWFFRGTLSYLWSWS